MSRPYIGERVYVVLPPAALADVDAIAARRGVSRGEVLREAVARYLDHNRRRKPAKERA